MAILAAIGVVGATHAAAVAITAVRERRAVWIWVRGGIGPTGGRLWRCHRRNRRRRCRCCCESPSCAGVYECAVPHYWRLYC